MAGGAVRPAQGSATWPPRLQGCTQQQQAKRPSPSTAFSVRPSRLQRRRLRLRRQIPQEAPPLLGATARFAANPSRGGSSAAPRPSGPTRSSRTPIPVRLEGSCVQLDAWEHAASTARKAGSHCQEEEQRSLTLLRCTGNSVPSVGAGPFTLRFTCARWDLGARSLLAFGALSGVGKFWLARHIQDVRRDNLGDICYMSVVFASRFRFRDFAFRDRVSGASAIPQQGQGITDYTRGSCLRTADMT